MKKTIVKFVLFCMLLAAVYAFALWQVAQGQVDYFYPKFTHQASSLIVGGSRSGDGISPLVLEREFSDNQIEIPVLNFSFAHRISDYGPIYFSAIQKKLYQNNKKGLFIVEVTPAALTILSSETDTITTINNDDTFISKIKNFNKEPNFEYIRKMYTHSLYQGFYRDRRIEEYRYTHDNGWQEIMRKNGRYEFSDSRVIEMTNKKLEETRYSVDKFKQSELRQEYLDKVIAYLNDYGNVYVVRMPVHSEFLKIENDSWPGFNDRIQYIADKNKVAYFDYSMNVEQYEFYDGSHLFGHSAKDFTQKLCDDIKAYGKEK